MCIAAFFANASIAQLNMELKSTVEYSQNLNDVWGWHNPVDNREYALVGTVTGLSIIDVTDTENPVDVGFADGPSSTWRDIKTWEGFAYVTNESGGGLLVVDLRGLPTPITTDDYYYWAPNIPGLGILSSIHNIYIDEFGYIYLPGSNLNNGGMLVVDAFTTPGQPEFVSAAPAVYSHDVYVRDNIMYSSEIYEGTFTLYDVNDKQNISLINSQATEFEFTHNTWLSDDGNTIFTTDERADAPVGSYDISDPNNIQELDQFRPATTLGDGVIPHNVHVWNDWVIVSYYTDGCIIIDGSRPTNLIEVGNFDTFLSNSAGFNGVWGAYPFLPSETVLATDQGNGLYVMTPTYVRACYLEGNVTDINTGAPLGDVEIIIDSSIEDNLANTNVFGAYGSGLATAGTYDVTFTKANYFPVTIQATLDNGVVTIADVQMQPSVSSYTLSGQVVDENNVPIPNAIVRIVGGDVEETMTANTSGNFAITTFEGAYQVFAGLWGYVNAFQNVDLSEDLSPVLVLTTGYADDFVVDLGWQSTGTASTGLWEFGVPIGTTAGGGQSNPGADVTIDIGNACYVTGNGGGGAGNDDVDDGNVVLTSPVMDLSNYTSAQFTYNRWFYNGGGAGAPNDELVVSISNGFAEMVLETVSNSNPSWGFPMNFTVLDTDFDLTDNMTIRFETSDDANSGHLVEAGLDRFLVTGELVPVDVQEIDPNLSVKVYPNPFDQEMVLEYNFEGDYKSATANIYNILGQKMESITLNNLAGSVSIGAQLNAGVYFIQIETDHSVAKTIKVIKN